MVIKIFYFAVAIFAVAMVILSVQTPYVSDIFKEDAKIAVIEMNGVTDYQISSEQVLGKFDATSGKRFKKHDEFENFHGIYLGEDVNHTLKSKKATIKGKVITLQNDAKYSNSDDINYTSSKIIYNSKTKIINSPKEFRLTQNQDIVIGNNATYDMNKKQTFAKGVHGWFQTED